MKNNQKKSKWILWILGWILCFPIPLTILIVRSQRLNKTIKIVILSIFWFFISLGLVLDVTGLSKKEEERIEQIDSSKSVYEQILTNVSDFKDGAKVDFDETNGQLFLSYERTKAIWDENTLITTLLSDYVKYCSEAYTLDEVQSVNFVGSTVIRDAKGNEKMSEVFRIQMDRDVFETYNWKNLQYKEGIYDTIVSDCSVFWIHPGILKNMDSSKIYIE